MKTKIVSIIAIGFFVASVIVSCLSVTIKRDLYNSKSSLVLSPEQEMQIKKSIATIEQYFVDNGTTLNDEIQRQSANTITTMSAPPNWLDNPEKYDTNLMTAWTAIRAYFSSQGYYLAQELLYHAWENTEYYSYYSPSDNHASRVLQSSVFSSIAHKITYEQGSEFPKSGTVAEHDLYYAIHSFDYTKSYVSGGQVKITIRDKYNYEWWNYENPIITVANNTMKIAETVGFLTPYYTTITYTVAGVPFPNYTNTVANDGDFVVDTYTGAIYVIAGGAPLYVPNWASVGGAKPTIAISHSVLLTLPQFPKDRTVLRTENNSYWIVAGGKPFLVKDPSHVLDLSTYIDVSLQTVLNAGLDILYHGHLRDVPLEEALVVTWYGKDQHGNDIGDIFYYPEYRKTIYGSYVSSSIAMSLIIHPNFTLVDYLSV